MASVDITRTTALFPDAVFVQWTITPDEEDNGSFIVDIARSGAPEGPWEPLQQSALNAYQFLDKNFNLPMPSNPADLREGLQFFSLSRDVYYQVTARSPKGNVIVSAARPIEPGLDLRTRLLKRKILHDEVTGFRFLNGIPIMVLKRRHWGTRCPDCYDPGLREGTQEHCLTCFGTTFVGGYWTPILVRGRRSPAPVQTQITSKGKSELKLVNFIMLDYPHLEPDDMLVDLQRNDRFLVQTVTLTELKTVTVHQTVTASLVERGAVEYDVKVDPRTTPPLY